MSFLLRIQTSIKNHVGYISKGRRHEPERVLWWLQKEIWLINYYLWQLNNSTVCRLKFNSWNDHSELSLFSHLKFPPNKNEWMRKENSLPARKNENLKPMPRGIRTHRRRRWCKIGPIQVFRVLPGNLNIFVSTRFLSSLLGSWSPALISTDRTRSFGWQNGKLTPTSKT